MIGTKICDLECRNGRVVCVISLAFGTYYVKVVEDAPIESGSEMLRKELVLNDVSLLVIFAGNCSQRGHYNKATTVASENLTYNQP